MARPVFNIKKVALKVKEQTTLQLIASARHYVEQMTGNPDFPNPTPPLAQVNQHIADVEQAWADAQSRTIGLAGITLMKRKLLELDLTRLAGHVEYIANQDADRAVSIIEGAGMPLKRPRSKTAKEFSARRGKESGTVVLNTKAENRAIYMYQMTKTPDIPSSWETVYYDRKVKYVIRDLPEGMHYFRTGIGGEHSTGLFRDAVEIMVV
jgi:hypothetical protein